MAGIDNDVNFGLGYRLQATSSTQYPLMQQLSTDVGESNNSGSPEGVVSANPGSLCHDRTNGVIYIKKTGTGNTGWELVTQGTATPLTLTGDSGGALSATAGNWNILGQQAGTVAVMDTIGSGSTIRCENRSWTTPYIVDSSTTAGLRGTYSTIASALTAASSGQTIFIRAGTYTENLTLKAGVNLVAYDADAFTPNVSIVGKCTATFAGSCSISGIRLTTNTDNFLAVTGNSATIVNLINCYLNCLDATGITYSSSSGSSLVNIFNCQGDLGTTGIKIFDMSSSGRMVIFGSRFLNTGASVTASTISAGILDLEYCYFRSTMTTSGTAGIFAQYVYWICSALNTTSLTAGGSNSSSGLTHCNLNSGSASDIVVTASLGAYFCSFNSSNASVISGAGTIYYSNSSFLDSSSTIAATTQTPRVSTNDAVKVVTPGAYPYTTIPQDTIILVDTSAARTITPLASPTTGQRHIIKDSTGSAGVNNITVTPSGKNIDGAASFVMNSNYASITIIYSGAEWKVC